MKRVVCSPLVDTLPFGSALADAPKSKNAKITVVYQHELPNVPGQSIKGVLVEYGPGGYSPGHTHAKSAFIRFPQGPGDKNRSQRECRSPP
jgi:quercetin dioxygenase-like cupin family protein